MQSTNDKRYTVIEPPHDKTNKMACAPTEDSDQPGHLPSLIRVLDCVQWVAKGPSFRHADSEDSDQTGPAGRTCQFDGFVMLQLNFQ